MAAEDRSVAPEEEPVSLEPPPGSSFTSGDVVVAEALAAPPRMAWGLLYKGAISSLWGEPGVGKSWIAIAIALRVLADGGSVLILDWEDSVQTTASRLRALLSTSGATEEQLGNVVYLRGSGPLTESDASWLPRLAGAAPDVLVIVDSVGESMAAWGLDENLAGDFLSWGRRLVRPLADAGATVLMLDHVAKDAGRRGRWPRASTAKLGFYTGCGFSFDVAEPFSRGGSGLGSLTVCKDRHGCIGPTGASVATIRFVVRGGSLVEVAVDRQEGLAHGDDRSPAILHREEQSL